MEWLTDNWLLFLGILLAGGLLLGAAVRLIQDAQYRAAVRPCPRCGADVPKGTLDCRACGFDFRAIGRSDSHADSHEG